MRLGEAPFVHMLGHPGDWQTTLGAVEYGPAEPEERQSRRIDLEKGRRIASKSPNGGSFLIRRLSLDAQETLLRFFLCRATPVTLFFAFARLAPRVEVRDAVIATAPMLRFGETLFAVSFGRSPCSTRHARAIPVPSRRAAKATRGALS